jgi:type IV secretory pathway VirB4 component
MALFGKKKTQENAGDQPQYEYGNIDVRDIIAPAAIEVTPNYVKLGRKFARTFFVYSYPRYLYTNWLSPVINMPSSMDITLFVYPADSATILKNLRRKVTEVQAELMEREEKGLIRDPMLETAFQDLEDLRDKLQTAQERMFEVGLYITLYGESLEELEKIETDLRSVLEGRLVYIRSASFQQKEGFAASAPALRDRLNINTPLNTEPLSSFFPFVSFDLTSNEGILYGINRHNNGLILFDRFSLENANSVVFAKSGAGKSYAVKLEILRSLMQGVDVIVIDPENEYQTLAETVGGSFFKISLTSPHHINPFDLPPIGEDEHPSDVLRSNIINLVGLLRIMLGGLTPEEDALIDRALQETYAARDITPDVDFSQTTPPLLSDLQTILDGMEGAESLSTRLQKYTKGTYSGFMNQYTNVNMQNNMVVFGIRDMEESLRPIAMFIILRYLWNTIRYQLKKRIVVVDEAWWMMQYEDGASFLYGLAKRSRKYWLGLTTITQDVGDFLKSTYGTPIVTNSSMQLLLRQSPATIDAVQKVFNLTEEEKYLLLESQVGEGLFFAGQKHVAIKTVASYVEDQIITTSPEQIQQIKQQKELQE